MRGSYGEKNEVPDVEGLPRTRDRRCKNAPVGTLFWFSAGSGVGKPARNCRSLERGGARDVKIGTNPSLERFQAQPIWEMSDHTAKLWKLLLQFSSGITVRHLDRPHPLVAGAQVARNTVFARQPRCCRRLDWVGYCLSNEGGRRPQRHLACQRTLGANPVMRCVRCLPRSLLGIYTWWWISVSWCSPNPLLFARDIAGRMDALPRL